MRQQVVLLPHPAPSSIIPTTPHLAPSSASTVVAMPVSDANSKVSLNHNDQDATPHGGASCCGSVIGDLHWYPGVSRVGQRRTSSIDCSISALPSTADIHRGEGYVSSATSGQSEFRTV